MEYIQVESFDQNVLRDLFAAHAPPVPPEYKPLPPRAKPVLPELDSLSPRIREQINRFDGNEELVEDNPEWKEGLDPEAIVFIEKREDLYKETVAWRAECAMHRIASWPYCYANLVLKLRVTSC